MNRKLSPDRRADLLIAQMTLDEKVELTTGTGPFQRYSSPPIPRLGIPPVDNTDSGLGVRASAGLGATSFPAGPNQAGSFDPAILGRQGNALGHEAWLLGHNEALAPQIDIARVPESGRLFETYGEDPLLTKEMARKVIAGIQDNHVMALVKHYNVYNQESDRTLVDAEVSERALREIYTKPWEGAIAAHAAGALCTYNKVNGYYNCANHHLLTDVLKGALDFKGFVQSDFGSTVSTLDALAGQDIEGPYQNQYFGTVLKAAVEQGEVPLSRVDDMVHRVLREYFAIGLFDNTPPGLYLDPAQRQKLPAKVIDADDRLAQTMGERGSVLLKNNGILPLNSNKVRSIAVIGADADWNIQGAGSGSVIPPTELTTTLKGITDRSNAQITYAPGTDPAQGGDMLAGPAPIPSAVLTPTNGTSGQHGLLGTVYSGTDFNPANQTNQVTVPQLDYLGGLVQLLGVGVSQVPPLPDLPSPFSSTWTGTLTPPATGQYTLAVTHWGLARLYVNGQKVLDDPGNAQNTVTEAKVNLTAGVPADIRVEYATTDPDIFQFFGGANIRLGWIPPANALPPLMKTAVTAAKKSDVAVVVVRDFNSEGADRANLTLPQDQDRLVSAVAAVNPRTIVVSETGAPISMPWLPKVAAVLQTWYAGQEQGKVVARLLYGDVNPSGKLTVTFPTTGRNSPISTVEQWPGVNKVATYSEGIFVGYRGYQQYGIKPLFPFGYGLSYTKFSVGGLKTTGLDSTGSDSIGHVSFAVTNTGTRAGAQIVQVYAGRLPGNVITPPKQLVAFDRITLALGQTKKVTLDVARESVSYFDTGRNAFFAPRGSVPITVGFSSADSQLTGSMKVS